MSPRFYTSVRGPHLCLGLFILPFVIVLAMNEVTVEFRGAKSGEPVEVGTVKLDLDRNVQNTVMHSGSTITPDGEPGRYPAKIKPDMAGDRTAQLHYDGPRGQGQVGFTVNVKP